jgi:hypothetical protein
MDNTLVKTTNKISDLSIAEQKAIQDSSDDICYIVDTSGSMGSEIDGKRKIDIVSELLKDLFVKDMIAFSTRAEWTVNVGTNLGHSTNLFTVVELLEPVQDKFKKCIILCDGQYNAPESTVREFKRIKIPIDVIFIGNDDYGYEQLKRLATGLSTKINDNTKNYSELLQNTVVALLN